MPGKLKRLIGNTVLVVFVLVYILIAMGVGNIVAATKPMWVQIIFFAVAGLGWVPIAMLIVSWMYRGAKKAPADGGSH